MGIQDPPGFLGTGLFFNLYLWSAYETSVPQELDELVLGHLERVVGQVNGIQGYSHSDYSFH